MLRKTNNFKNNGFYLSIIFFCMIAVLIITLPGYAQTLSVSKEFTADDGSGDSVFTGRYCIARDDKPLFIIDAKTLTKHDASHEVFLCRTNDFQIKPTQDRVLLFANQFGKGSESGIIYVIDPQKRTTKKITSPINIPKGKMQWLSADLLHIRPEAGDEASILVDLKKNVAVGYAGGLSQTFDKNGKNAAFIYGENPWVQPKRGPTGKGKTRAEGLVWSIFLIYNGGGVYPEVKQKMDMDFYGTPKQLAQGLFSNSGVYIPSRCYDLSAPIFLAETPWVGFIENIYSNDVEDIIKKMGKIKTPPGEPPMSPRYTTKPTTATLLETNIVCVDAHTVTKKPVKLSDVHVVKRSLPQIKDIEFSRDAKSVWNDQTQSLEIWEANRRENTLIRKLVEVPVVSFEPLTLGQPKIVDGPTTTTLGHDN